MDTKVTNDDQSTERTEPRVSAAHVQVSIWVKGTKGFLKLGGHVCWAYFQSKRNFCRLKHLKKKSHNLKMRTLINQRESHQQGPLFFTYNTTLCKNLNEGAKKLGPLGGPLYIPRKPFCESTGCLFEIRHDANHKFKGVTKEIDLRASRFSRPSDYFTH
jgi:hypothetical protein